MPHIKSKATTASAPNGRTNGHTNGNPSAPVDGANSTPHGFNPHFTQAVIDAMGPGTNPRLRQVMTSLIRHVHDFARENLITVDEWMAGLEMLNEAGRMSDDRRNEGLLLGDVIGLESLVDEITHRVQTQQTKTAPTATAILGPFWRRNAPRHEMGDCIVHGISDGDKTFICGSVRDCVSGKAIDGAELDVWLTAPNGLYEQQDQKQPDMNLRGTFRTGPDGRYYFYCIRPTSYPIPDDGPAGRLLNLMDRHPMRPAHIHFIVTAPGYKPIVTQIFDRCDQYLHSDAVFAVKESLIVDFVPRHDDPKADFELDYDFLLAPVADLEAASKGFSKGSH